MLQRKGRILPKWWNSPFLKQFQLLTWCVGLLGFGAEEELNVAKLFVRDAHNTNLSELW